MRREERAERHCKIIERVKTLMAGGYSKSKACNVTAYEFGTTPQWVLRIYNGESKTLTKEFKTQYVDGRYVRTRRRDND